MDNWPEIERYQNTKKSVKSVKVMDDCAKRAIALSGVPSGERRGPRAALGKGATFPKGGGTITQR